MRDDGKSIILITHKLEEILEIADEVTVLRDGCQVGGEKITNQTTKSDLTNMMVGREVFLSLDETLTAQGKHCVY